MKYVFECYPNYNWNNPFRRKFIIFESDSLEKAESYIRDKIQLNNIIYLGENPIIISNIKDQEIMYDYYCFNDKPIPLIIQADTCKIGYSELDSVINAFP